MRPNNRFAADGPLRGPPLNQNVSVSSLDARKTARDG